MVTMNIQVQCPVLLWVWLQFELVCDDPRNTVLVMPPLLSHTLWGEKSGEENTKLANTVEMASLDTEMISCVWEERRGETLVVWLVKFACVRACVKS